MGAILGWTLAWHYVLSFTKTGFSPCKDLLVLFVRGAIRVPVY